MDAAWIGDEPFDHRLGHGTMCAYDALIAAPNATLLDFPMLLARPVADHHSKSTADAALLAYAPRDIMVDNTAV